ncbi:hypothetical protein [Lysobacter sp. D1-1-M9]|uniref:hypothetical protein n=2 Tax=Novilysobacter TaxID=3382699 RepID=UPI002FC74058
MNFSADELRNELDRLDATMTQTVRRAGGGLEPDFERRLDTHLRSLRAMLVGDGTTAAADVIEAAKRAINSADPAAPLMMLAMARETLAAVARRQITRATAPDLAA